MMRTFASRGVAAGRTAIAGALALGLVSCGLDEVQVPILEGPSTFANALVVRVTPDVLLADAVSTANVTAQLRGPNGQPQGGTTIFFAITDEGGNYIDLGTLYSTQGTFHPPAPQTTEVTGTDGIARVTYRVPERIRLTAIQRVFIQARIVGNDAQGQVFKSAAIELRPAEVRRYPDQPGSVSCAIIVDPERGPYPAHTTVRFFTGSTGGIVRYFWSFGDGAQDDKPDVQHAWSRPGTFSVTHVVTASSGDQAECSINMNITP